MSELDLQKYIDAWVERQRSTFWAWLRARLGMPDPYAPEPEPPAPPDPGEQDIPGSSGFLWKPVSENDGKAVTLFDKRYRLKTNDPYNGHKGAKLIASVFIEGGDRDGDKPRTLYWPTPKPGQAYVNGNMIHGRWKAAGKEFGKNFDVVLTTVDGEVKTWRVKDGAKRQ